MHLRDLPHPDPGVPDVRTGGAFLRWLCRRQLGGQLKALAWGLVNIGAIAASPCRWASPCRPWWTATAGGSSWPAA
ncbi:hypothetical protein Srufu_009050 [Streptomyces libani subsp. rufus]|nr:hypothetical protein Srufu_009050 [Streptomyces libani subsp. rufus]